MGSIQNESANLKKKLLITMWVPAIAMAVVSIVIGAADLASLSGELPVDDPTPSEIRIWDRGWMFLWIALALTVISGTLFAFIPSRISENWALRLCLGTIVAVVLVAVAAITTWFIVLPDVS